jgi:hypothetical protein
MILLKLCCQRKENALRGPQSSVENFSPSDYRRFWDDRPIIGDFATKQIDLDTSSLLHPGGSNAAQEPA